MNKLRIVGFVIAGLIAMTAQRAFAQSTGDNVIIIEQNNAFDQVVDALAYFGGASVSRNVAATASRVNIFPAVITGTNPLRYTATIANTDYGNISLSRSSGPSALDIVFGIGPLLQGDFPPAKRGGNLSGLNVLGVANTSKRLYGGIGGSVTGQIQGITQIARFDAGGEIQGSIVANSGINGGFCVIEAASFSTQASIQIASGEIRRVKATSGSMLGSVSIANGSITSVEVAGSLSASLSAPNGAIGAVTVSGSISSPSITAGASINTIDGFGTVSSTITAGGNLQRLRITGGGSFTGSLNVGSISSTLATDGVSVAGSISGPITVTGDVSRQITATSAISSPLTINGNLLSTGTISAQSLSADLRVNETLSGTPTITNGLPAGRTIRIGDSLSRVRYAVLRLPRLL